MLLLSGSIESEIRIKGGTGMSTIYDNSVTATPIAANCGHKLPCGVCRLMMCMCPINGTPVVTPTWTASTSASTDVELTSQTKAEYKEGEQE